ncbi:LOW QUALITY PROTEIN: glutathionyl-hydroquinone reductase YqjG-like [Paramacrobiotus metropolitanus]|uniref:LOW QUALITY PROTEIN: glutathionyl-hydroquinone reductase YqjG-like n=1 Tax=Paramacrobiotus metropolitanus TaxID=2943436 RepID=UPI002445C688|nr:LOW QUALITY PROTEIN: glutathionyl-hydroquinone reductase YqjG-like [Paramacrobiotus metropolitanus]
MSSTGFHNWITADGSSGFPAAANRYHLYVSYACPFAHRTIIGRSLKGLEDAISMSVVDWALDRSTGWAFNPDRPGATSDEVNHKSLLREIYEMASPGYSGRITVPVLWDKQKKTIVNNESADILRMFLTQFDITYCNNSAQKELNLYPSNLQKEIEAINEWVFEHINIGVYKCAFAKTQEEYDVPVKKLFQHLDKAEDILAKQRFLTGSRMTEADIRLFTTLLRFDRVYYILFKCAKKQIANYPNLWGWLRDMYQVRDIRKTVNMEHIRNHYYTSFQQLNPSNIVPIDANIDLDQSHGREAVGK